MIREAIMFFILSISYFAAISSFDSFIEILIGVKISDFPSAYIRSNLLFSVDLSLVN